MIDGDMYRKFRKAEQSAKYIKCSNITLSGEAIEFSKKEIL